MKTLRRAFPLTQTRIGSSKFNKQINEYNARKGVGMNDQYKLEV
jgi:hypothetical protein